jgi:copper chaperone CopZ
MKEEIIAIRGMSCQHCVMAVRKELEKVEGLVVREVSVGAARIALDIGKISPGAVDRAVAAAGYQVIGRE